MSTGIYNLRQSIGFRDRPVRPCVHVEQHTLLQAFVLASSIRARRSYDQGSTARSLATADRRLCRSGTPLQNPAAALALETQDQRGP